MEQYWDALRRAGWVPGSANVDAWKLWSCGANILPSLAESWQQTEPNRLPADRRQKLCDWLSRNCATGSQLTLGWPGGSSVVTPRLFWWRDGVPSGWRIGVLSSHLGRRLDQHPRWFHALRRLCARLDPTRDQLVTCETITTDRYLRYCGVRFGLRLIALQWPSDRQSIRAWLRELVRQEPVETAVKRDCCVHLSPRLVGQGSAIVDSCPEPDWLVGCCVDELYILYLRPRGRLQRVVARLLRQSERPKRIHLALGNGLVPPNVAKPLLSLGAVGWHLLDTDGEQGCAHPSTDEPAFSYATESAPIVTPPADESWTYLVHWTRRQFGPWPDQDEEAYLNELLFDFRQADRSALAALTRIITMQRILATRRLIRGAFDVVCFSQRCLAEWAPCRIFRKHQQRWDFELYGLCIDRQWLIDRNTRPVIYGDDLTWERMSPEERPFFQRRVTQASPTRKSICWSDEQEWRHRGDLDLHRLPVSLGLVFVPTEDAARKIAQISRWPVTVIDRGTAKD